MLRNPANRHKAVALTPKQWTYDFTGTFTDEDSRRLYERYHVPASGRVFWDSVLANFRPGRQATWVDYRNEERAPLLFVSGSEDKLMPPAIQRSNLKKYKGRTTVTERVEYEGFAHLLPAQEGWEQVADDVLEWALAQAAATQEARAA